MMPEPFENLTVRFHGCESGWIYLDLNVGERSQTICISHVFDPFPDLLSWMEAILTGVQECRAEIDEEGMCKILIATRRWDERILLRIRNSGEDADLLFAVLHRSQLIEALYRGIQRFAKSSEYIPEQWAAATLGDYLLQMEGFDSQQKLLDALLEMGTYQLQELFFLAAPISTLTVPSAANDDEQLRIFVEHTLRPTDELEAKVVRESVWIFDEAYDTWSRTRKREYLINFLNEQVSGYGGTPLETLCSERLEEFLAEKGSDLAS